MILVGGRFHCTSTLADYLLSNTANEAVFIREIEPYPLRQLSPKNLANALRLMELQAFAKGGKRALYHVVLSLPNGEALNQQQLRIALDTLTDNLKLTLHQRVVVEHWKHGRQHFHILYNVIHPLTGRRAPLYFKNLTLRRTGMHLEKLFGLKPEIVKGRSIHFWEKCRGKRSGINPFLMRAEVTAIYNKCQKGSEFIAALAKAGYIVSQGRFSYVIVDRAGDPHGLVRRIEGARLADLDKKFPDLKKIPLPPLEEVRKRQRKAYPRKKIARDCRAARHLLKRDEIKSNHLHSRAPALQRPLSSKSLRKISPLPLPTMPYRPGRQRTGELQAYAPLPQGKYKPHLNEPAKADYPDPDFERAELIAWAFRNGRFDILAQFGIFCAPSSPEAHTS